MKSRMLMVETKKWWFFDMGSRLIWGECGGGPWLRRKFAVSADLL